MPADWSRSLDVDRLVAGLTDWPFAIPLSAMPRLQDRLLDSERAALAEGRVRFTREFGVNVAQLELRAQVPLRCERCLRPMHWPVNGESRIALVADLGSADRVPEGLEPLVAEHGKIRLVEVVEEEILLGLPLISRHTNAADCTAEPSAVPAAPPTSAERQQPFKGLADLLKSRSTEGD